MVGVVYNLNNESECPICHISYSITPKDGPENSDTYIHCSCKHYFCVGCIENMYISNIRNCIICNFNFTDWIESHYPLEHNDYEEFHSDSEYSEDEDD